MTCQTRTSSPRATRSIHQPQAETSPHLRQRTVPNAEQFIAVFPRLREIAQANRAFLRRALTAAFQDHGIRQVLDIGCGLPGEGHIAEVTYALAPDCRAVFVDRDPIVLAHVQARLCHGTPYAAIYGDLRDPGALLAHSALHEALDLRRPVALVLGFVLHYLSDIDHPHDAVDTIIQTLAPGSVLILSHATAEAEPEPALEAAGLYRSLGMPVSLRTPAQIAAFFNGLELEEPGLVAEPRWRPDHALDDDADVNWGYGALARKH